jgi:hypothetical protein
MPNISLTLGLCIASFFAITSGAVHCFVTESPMMGYSRNEQGKIVASWMMGGVSQQLLAEGIIASLTYSLGACSLIVAFYEITKPEKSKTEIDRYLAAFAYSAPFWAFCSFQVFKMKIPSYFPSFGKKGNA